MGLDDICDTVASALQPANNHPMKDTCVRGEFLQWLFAKKIQKTNTGA